MKKLFVLVLLVLISIISYAQEIPTKLRANYVCEFDQEKGKWTEWQETYYVIAFVDDFKRIKITGTESSYFDVLNYEFVPKTNTERPYIKFFGQDKFGQDVWITFGESGSGLRFIMHLNDLDTVICYDVEKLQQ